MIQLEPRPSGGDRPKGPKPLPTPKRLEETYKELLPRQWVRPPYEGRWVAEVIIKGGLVMLVVLPVLLILKGLGVL